MTILEKIPTLVTVAVLVGIFAGLKRHSHSARLQLWLVAWFLVFTHFVAQMFEPASGATNPLLLASIWDLSRPRLWLLSLRWPRWSTTD